MNNEKNEKMTEYYLKKIGDLKTINYFFKWFSPVLLVRLCINSNSGPNKIIILLLCLKILEKKKL